MKLELFPLVAVVVLVSCTDDLQQVNVTKTSEQDSELGTIVDNQDGAMHVEGSWSLVQSPSAYNGDCLLAPVWKDPSGGSLAPAQSAMATARLKLPQAGMYEVYAWWCGAEVDNLSTQQRIWLCASLGYSCVSIFINPHDNAGQWNGLGTYYLDTNGDVTVQNGATQLGAPPGWDIIADGAVVIDAFKFAYRSPRPSVLTPLPLQPYPSPTPEA